MWDIIYLQQGLHEDRRREENYDSILLAQHTNLLYLQSKIDHKSTDGANALHSIAHELSKIKGLLVNRQEVQTNISKHMDNVKNGTVLPETKISGQ